MTMRPATAPIRGSVTEGQAVGVRQPGRGLAASALSVCPYSPDCVEGEFCELRVYGVLGSWSTLKTGSTTRCSGSGRTNHGGAMRSGYPDGPLALGVLGCERSEPFARFLELVGSLDGNPERPGLQQLREPLQ